MNKTELVEIYNTLELAKNILKKKNVVVGEPIFNPKKLTIKAEYKAVNKLVSGYSLKIKKLMKELAEEHLTKIKKYKPKKKVGKLKKQDEPQLSSELTLFQIDSFLNDVDYSGAKKKLMEFSINYLEDAINKGMELGLVEGIGKLNPEQALRFIEKYSYDLITGIVDNVRDGIRETMYKGLSEGWNFDDFVLALQNDFTAETGFASTYRASMIAHTEIMRALNYGKIELWKSYNFEKKQWYK